MTVGEIVADNFGNAEVFDKYGIDFCCHGSVLLPEAGRKAGADMDKVIKDIESLTPPASESIDFKSWPLDLLVDYILDVWDTTPLPYYMHRKSPSATMHVSCNVFYRNRWLND